MHTTSGTLFPARGFRPLALLCGALLTLALAACGLRSGPKVSVPMQETAEKQYAYAVQYREARTLALITDPKKLALARAVVRQHFAKVIEYYPDDRLSTPLARLEIADMDAGLDNRRVKVSNHELRGVIADFQKLAKDYPDNEFIQAKTLFDEGLCYKRMGAFAKAQECFKKVRDTHGASKNRDIAALAKTAAFYYNQTYVNE